MDSTCPRRRPCVLLHSLTEGSFILEIPRSYEERFRQHFDVIRLKDVVANPALRERVVGAVCHPGPKSALNDHLAWFPNLKVISNYGVGMDNLASLYPECKKRGIMMAYVPHGNATADMAMCLILATARNIRIDIEEAMGSNPITAFNGNSYGVDVSLATLGIVGMGNIGYRIAQRAKGFEMRILYHSRTPRSPEIEASVGARYYTRIHDMLKEVDFVVIACPLTSETNHLFNDAEFNCMKSTATIINVARGSVIHTDALVRALKEMKIRAAGLDVTDPEPLPRDHPLLVMNNVVITPHAGTKTVQTREYMDEVMVENVLSVIEGRPLVNEWKP